MSSATKLQVLAACWVTLFGLACSGDVPSATNPGTISKPETGTLIPALATSGLSVLQRDSSTLQLVVSAADGAIGPDSIVFANGWKTSSGTFIQRIFAKDSGVFQLPWTAFGRNSANKLIRLNGIFRYTVIPEPQYRGIVSLLMPSGTDTQEGWQVILRFKNFADTSITDSRGNYAVRLHSLDVSDSIPVELSVRPKSGSRYSALYAKITTGYIITDAQYSIAWRPYSELAINWIAASVSEWTIKDGSYSGTIVPIGITDLQKLSPYDADKAIYDGGSNVATYDQRYDVYVPCMAGPCSTSDVFGYQRGNLGYYSLTVPLKSMLPIPVVLDHEARQVITADDSVQVWTQLNDLNARLGGGIFTPASTIRSSGPQIVISIDTTDQGVAGRGGTSQLANGRGGFYVTDRAYFRSSRVVQHEMMHALGVGHTCAFASVMMYSSWQGRVNCPGQATSVISPKDVANWQFLRAYREEMESHRTFFGYFESLNALRLTSPSSSVLQVRTALNTGWIP